MGNVIQWAPALVGIVIAITLVVALFQLVAIRKLLEKLLQQSRIPATQPRAGMASERALWTEAPEQASPERRLEIVSPPSPPQARFEAAREQVMPAVAPAILSPPPPAAPVQQPRFGVVPEQAPSAEEIPDQGPPAEAVSDWARPAESPATADLEPPVLAAPRPSRLPVIIGIIVLLGAIGFLAFLVIYTK